MRIKAILLAVALAACGGAKNRICTPVPSFSAPAGECVAMAEAPKPPPPPPPKKDPEPEPEPPPPEPPPPEPPPPEPPPTVVVTADKIELDRTVQFQSGKSKLLDDSKKLLDDVVKVLSEHTEIKLIQIEGHTDSVGNDRKNKKLSDARAKAVRAYLIAGGINKKRMVAKGFGEAKPVAENDTDEGRFKNRRVDLKILKKDDAEPKKDEEKKEEKKEEKAEKSDDAIDDAAEKKDKKKEKPKKGKKAPAAEKSDE